MTTDEAMDEREKAKMGKKWKRKIREFSKALWANFDGDAGWNEEDWERAAENFISGNAHDLQFDLQAERNRAKKYCLNCGQQRTLCKNPCCA